MGGSLRTPWPQPCCKPRDPQPVPAFKLSYSLIGISALPYSLVPTPAAAWGKCSQTPYATHSGRTDTGQHPYNMTSQKFLLSDMASEDACLRVQQQRDGHKGLPGGSRPASPSYPVANSKEALYQAGERNICPGMALPTVIRALTC